MSMSMGSKSTIRMRGTETTMTMPASATALSSASSSANAAPSNSPHLVQSVLAAVGLAVPFLVLKVGRSHGIMILGNYQGQLFLRNRDETHLPGYVINE